MISRSSVKLTSNINFVGYDKGFVILFKAMYKETIMRFGFCDVKNNKGLG